MKLISIVLFTIFASFSAQAAGPIIEDVTQSTFIEADCPVCAGGQEVTLTTIKFSQEWCASVTSDIYEVKVAERSTFGGDNYKTVQVQLKKMMADCMGPSYLRTFKLTTRELKKGERVILQNPSVM